MIGHTGHDHRQPPVHRAGVGQREDGHAAPRLHGAARPGAAGDDDRLHRAGGGHEERRGADPLPRAGAPELRVGHLPRPDPAGLPPGGGAGRPLLQPAAASPTRAGPARSTAPTSNRRRRSTSGRTPPRSRRSPRSTPGSRRCRPDSPPTSSPWPAGCAAELFVDALRNAGTDPSRGSLLQALRKITAFQSGNLIPVSNPAGKVPITCYLLGQVAAARSSGSTTHRSSGPTTGSAATAPTTGGLSASSGRRRRPRPPAVPRSPPR